MTVYVARRGSVPPHVAADLRYIQDVVAVRQVPAVAPSVAGRLCTRYFAGV